MKVSLNTIKQFTDVNTSVDELVKKINEQLGGVEEVIDLGKRYQGATIAKVLSCEKHANADTLSVCQIDAGTGENVQVVCGANNVREGIYVVWLSTASIVPSTFDDKEPFVLEPKELRGVLSDGMLASARELGLGDDHDGIVEIDPDEWKPNQIEVKAGTSFAEAYGLNDTIIDIENKMFTHRPDLFGQLGVAREISAITKGLPSVDETAEDVRFVNPEWYWSSPNLEGGSGLELDVYNDALGKSARFMAVAVDNVAIKPSPLWLQCALVAMGSKPINNVVDLTNYIMLITAQPTHAYDYDKLRGSKIGVRMAQQGEEVTLLNHKTYRLRERDMVIADAQGPIGLAGIMGGSDSEVDSNTRRLVLEVATFDMYVIRKSAMHYGLFTDAVTRFTKGQSHLQNNVVLAKLVEMITEYTGGTLASSVHDLPAVSKDQYEGTLSGEVLVSAEFINQRLGTNLTPQQIGDLLRRVNFASYPPENDDTSLLITAPYWRTDIELPEDIVEEVGRLYGFDKLPLELPTRTLKPPVGNPKQSTKEAVRRSLSAAGANEVLTYSFVHEKVLARAGQDASQAFKLSNALSPDLQYYRLSVLPSLLDKVHQNIKSGHDMFTLFEIGKGHNKMSHADDDNGLPGELEFVDAVYASKKPQAGAAYYQLRRQLDELASDLGTTLVYRSIPEVMDYPITAPFNQSRSAMVEDENGIFVGMIGELKQSVRRQFKLPDYAAAMSLDLGGLVSIYTQKASRYAPLSRYPSVIQDISLKVPHASAYADIAPEARQAALEVAPNLDTTIAPVSIYMPEDNTSHKTVTLRVRVTSHERTLKDVEVAGIIQAISSRSVGQQV